MEYFFKDLYIFLVGCFISIIGYMFPVKNIIHLLVIFFILDVFFGFLAAKKIRKEKFSVKIIWENTIPRMLFSIVLISCAYLWDVVYEQEFISTYKIIGWFITGVLFYSIIENGYQITKWSIFIQLKETIKDKVKNSTGLDINDKK